MAAENRGKENRTGTTGAKKQGDEFRRNSDENANTTRVSRLNGAHQVRPGDRPKEKQQQKKNRGDFHEATFSNSTEKNSRTLGGSRCVLAGETACEIASNDVTAILNALATSCGVSR